MNLKEAEKIWRESQPLEANGMVGRNLPKRWAIKLTAHKNKKKRSQDGQE